MKPITAPESWEGTIDEGHWSFAYEIEGKNREDYDFRVEFGQGVPESEQAMVIRLIEAAPKLLRALDYLLQQTVDQDLKHGISLTEGEQEARAMALDVIAEVAGEAV